MKNRRRRDAKAKRAAFRKEQEVRQVETQRRQDEMQRHKAVK